MSIKVRVKMNLKFPNLALGKELLQVANEEIIPDIHKHMDTATDISGKKYRPLAESTIKQKARKGLRTDILHATGKLRRSIKANQVNKTTVAIKPKGGRPGGMMNQELGDILQNQGVRTKSGQRFFEFFGISKEAEARSINKLEQIIRERIERAGRS